MGAWSLLSPWYLAGAAAAAVPILLHLLKLRPERAVPFPAIRLIREVPTDESRRRRLRELLLLALRVAALVLLALAFARPFLAGAAGQAFAPVTVVAVDTSYSLSAPGQFDRARALAREAVSRLPAGQRVAVVAFSDGADVVAALSADHGAAVAAIDRLAPGFGATSYRAAFARCADLAGVSAGRLVLVTDLQAIGMAGTGAGNGSVATGLALDVRDVGAPRGNLAIVSLAATPAGFDVVLRNAGEQPAGTRVRLSLDARQVADQPVSVPPGADTVVSLAAAVPDRGSARAIIDDPTGYAADNERYLLLDRGAAASVVVLAGGPTSTRHARYAEPALQAAEAGGRGTGVHVVVPAEAAAALAGTGAQPPAVVVLSTRGLDRKGHEALLQFVERGGGLVVAQGPDVEPDRLTELLGDRAAFRAGEVADVATTLAPGDARHPVLRAFGASVSSLSQVRVTRFRPIDASSAHVLARLATGAPALLEFQVGRGRVLVFASDFDNEWNDLPRRPTFVPLLHELVIYAAAGPTGRHEFHVADLPPGVPLRPGIVTLPGNGVGGLARVAVNVDPAEGDPARLTPADLQGLLSSREAAAAALLPEGRREQEAQQQNWRYVLACAALLLLTEAWFAGRLA